MSEAREEYYKIYDDNGSLLDGSGYLRRTVHNYLKELEQKNKDMIAYLVQIDICKVCPECFKTLYCDLMNCNEYKKKLLIEKTGKSIEDIINESNT